MFSVKNKNDLGLLFLRLSIAGLMLVHGIPKLMKLFSAGPIQFADPIGIGMTMSLIMAVITEVLFSVFILIGFKTRFASLALAFTMFVAAFIVHGQDPWKVKEKAVLFLCAYLTLILTGPGKFSISK